MTITTFPLGTLQNFVSQKENVIVAIVPLRWLPFNLQKAPAWPHMNKYGYYKGQVSL